MNIYLEFQKKKKSLFILLPPLTPSLGSNPDGLHTSNNKTNKKNLGENLPFDVILATI